MVGTPLSTISQKKRIPPKYPHFLELFGPHLSKMVLNHQNNIENVSGTLKTIPKKIMNRLSDKKFQKFFFDFFANLRGIYMQIV